MTDHSTTPAGAPVWLDLLTSDIERANAFYSGLFGWTAGESDPAYGGYYMYFLDGEPVAGGMPNRPEFDAADRWGLHLKTDDAAATVAAVTNAGGRVMSDVDEIGPLGYNAMFTDPAGCGFGIWQAKDFAGFARDSVPGAPCWFELGTTDYEAAVDFYRAVFWLGTETVSDTANFRYTTLTGNDGPVAGIMDTTVMPGGDARTGWQVYFGVADTDAALDRVIGLGGTVTRPAGDSPFGRVAGVTDPTGAALTVISFDNG